jgi:hypothetical protein
MNDKNQMLTMLKDEFNRWEALLAGMSEEQITAPHPTSNWSIQDVIGHLRAWQQVSIARLEAAQLDRDPLYPEWLAGSDPESDEELDQFNARIYTAHHQRPWPSVYQDWRQGFLRFLQLGEAIPEEHLSDTTKYPWLDGYPLFAVLEGSYNHHTEHREELLG